jgi:hypothetical protein
LTKRVTEILNDLNLSRINKLSFLSEEKLVAVEFIDRQEVTHQVEFMSVDTYFFLDEKFLDALYEETGKQPITFFDPGYGEFVAVDEYEDGTSEETLISQPNVILNTDAASILLEAKRVRINGESYHLSGLLN